MRATTPHGCPHCRCDWGASDGPGPVNRDAPFYPLVALIDSLHGNGPCTATRTTLARTTKCPGGAVNTPGPAEHAGGARHG